LSDNGPDKKILPLDERTTRGVLRARTSVSCFLGAYRPLGRATVLAEPMPGPFLSIHPIGRSAFIISVPPHSSSLPFCRLFAAIKRHTIGAKRSRMREELEDERK